MNSTKTYSLFDNHPLSNLLEVAPAQKQAVPTSLSQLAERTDSVFSSDPTTLLHLTASAPASTDLYNTRECNAAMALLHLTASAPSSPLLAHPVTSLSSEELISPVSSSSQSKQEIASTSPQLTNETSPTHALLNELCTTQESAPLPKIIDSRFPIAFSKSTAKTLLCLQYVNCTRNYCSFAHHPNELIPLQVHRSYKRIPCKRELELNFCQYGYNCDFLHKQDNIQRNGRNALIIGEGGVIYRKIYYANY